MDLSVPYTFYPIALPGWIAWVLFLLAIAIGSSVGLLSGRRRGWLSGVFAGAIGVVLMLAATMLASMVITFFLHDI